VGVLPSCFIKKKSACTEEENDASFGRKRQPIRKVARLVLVIMKPRPGREPKWSQSKKEKE
jgi:hypothetical protein